MAETKRRAHMDRPPAGGELTSNGAFTKVVNSEGEIAIVPTQEIYTKNPGERMAGHVVQDDTVPGQVGRRLERTLVDTLEAKFTNDDEEIRPTTAFPHTDPFVAVTKPETGESGVEYDEDAELEGVEEASDGSRTVTRLETDEDGKSTESRVTADEAGLGKGDEKSAPKSSGTKKTGGTKKSKAASKK